MAKTLIREIDNTDPSTLEDLILVMAMNVERSLIEAGAQPGSDYTYQDLFNMATPFALEVFRRNESITYRISS